MFKKLSITALLILSACAHKPESNPAYISPSHYSDYNCTQISAERNRISTKLDQAGQVNATGQALDTALAAFAISQGYSFKRGGSEALERLKNQYEVLEQEAIQKECF